MLGTVNNNPLTSVYLYSGINKVSFKAKTENNNAKVNKKISESFDKGFQSSNMTDFIREVNNYFQPIIYPPRVSFLKTEIIEGNNPKIKNKDVTVGVNNRGHLQITHKDLGKLFSPASEIANTDENGKVIGDGIRGLDPAPQSKWEKAPLNRPWPPSKNQSITTKYDYQSDAIMFEAPYNSDYQVKAKGMVDVNPVDSSVTWAYQQENLNPNIDWGAWTIAPFRVPKGKKALNIFPVSNEFSVDEKNKQWEVKDGFALVKPNENGGFCDPFDKKTNWTAFAVEGSDKIAVMRSIYKEPAADKYKACVVENNARYVENEFIAPLVPKGEKSTIVSKIDFVPLKDLGINGKFEKENMEDQIREAAEELQFRLS